MNEQELYSLIHQIRILLFAITATELPERQHIHFREIRLLAQKGERGTK